MTAEPNPRPGTARRKFTVRSFVQWFAIGLVALWLLAALSLVAAKWIDPPTTAVHMERRVEAWIRHRPYRERYKFVPLSEISPNLQHAVIAPRTRASTSTMGSTGTLWSLPPSRMRRAGEFAEVPHSRSSSLTRISH